MLTGDKHAIFSVFLMKDPWCNTDCAYLRSTKMSMSGPDITSELLNAFCFCKQIGHSHLLSPSKVVTEKKSARASDRLGFTDRTRKGWVSPLAETKEHMEQVRMVFTEMQDLCWASRELEVMFSRMPARTSGTSC